MDEIQLIREIDEKRRREGKIKEPELNAKQKEALRLQLEKENCIRTKVAALNTSMEQSVSLLNTSLTAIGSVLSNHLTRLIPTLMRSMGSPVAAALYPLWINLRKCVFDSDEDILATGVAYVTQRLMKPQCDLDPAWETEAVETAARRILSNLHQSSSSTAFNASTFTYCFPLIRETLKLMGTQQDPLAVQGIQLMERHALIRSLDASGEVNLPLRNPRLLPLREMMELLTDLIGVWNGREQQMACVALLQVAGAASGAAGCTVATDEEVVCLLNGLESSVDSVRDACLNGLASLLNVLTKDRNKVFLIQS